MDNEQLFDTIEAYLEGTLPPEARKIFERNLNIDPALKQQLHKHQAARLLLEISATDRLVEETADNGLSGRRILFGRGRPYLWLAAACLMGLFMLWLYVGLGDRYSHQTIAMHHFEAYEGGGIRGETEESSPFRPGIQAYDRKAYAEAIQYFAQIQPDEARYPESRMFLGNSYLVTGRSQQAVEAFQNLRALNDSRFGAAADWYLCLAFLQQGDVEAAMQLAQIITETPRHSYSGRAKSLLEDLNSTAYKIIHNFD